MSYSLAARNQFHRDYNSNAEKFFGPGVKLASYHLQLLGVHPEHQRHGIATQLMAVVHEKVRIRFWLSKYHDAKQLSRHMLRTSDACSRQLVKKT